MEKKNMNKQTKSFQIYVVGNVNIDLLMGPLDEWPQRGTEALLPNCSWRAGGSAGNTALALDAIGADYQIVANRGNDVFGEWLSNHFAGKTHWSVTNGPTSVTVGITHHDNERTFITGEGNVELLSLHEVLTQLPKQSDQDIVLLSGTFLTLKLLEEYESLFTELKRRNYRIALDTGWPPQGWDEVRPRLLNWLPSIDYLLLNDLEITSLANERVLEKAIQQLGEWMSPQAWLVIKQGGNGASCWHQNQSYQVQAPLVEVHDTIGAGDIFNAGFLYAQAQHQSPEASLHWGITLASHTIASVPRRFMNASKFHALFNIGDD